MKTGRLAFKASPIHGIGGFASSDIPAGTRVIEYVGRKINKKESLCLCELNNQYIFALDEEYDLDGNVSFNPARFLNHSCAPNCEAELESGRIWIPALRDIGAAEAHYCKYWFDDVDYK